MEDGIIASSKIISSSEHLNHHAWKGRLNGDSCWSSKKTDKNAWFQVDFLSVVTITGIQIQGCPGLNGYLENLEIAKSTEISFFYILDNEGSKKVCIKHNIYLLFERECMIKTFQMFMCWGFYSSVVMLQH